VDERAYATRGQGYRVVRARRGPVNYSLVRRTRSRVALVKAPIRRMGFCALSRNARRHCPSFCRQKRQQNTSDHNENDHIGKFPVDAVNPGF
jgi:hypothetical protein